jgi:hypothetical protein
MTERPPGLDGLLNYVACNLEEVHIPVNCPHQGGSSFDRSICAAPCDTAHMRCEDCGAPLDRCAFEPSERHWPMYVRWQHRHTVPAEVCDTCSEPKAGKWVPVSFCGVAMARLAANPDCTYTYGVLHQEED